MIRLRFDPVSGALYLRVREGEIEETIPLAYPGFGASVDVDRKGTVMGLEFLSLEELAEIIVRAGGTLEIPDVVKDTELPLFPEGRQEVDAEDLNESLRRRIQADIASLPPRQQEILRAVFQEGLSQAEIARKQGITEDEVITQLKDAINNIRRSSSMPDEDVSNQPWISGRLGNVLRGGWR